ncbi:protein kinase [Streptomyces sp. NPDC015220]|uniref:serine/threonine-protein kinase n=1 Tax=Streptomyces sp. NPDC015220 TaxID=3364947 RepID=UPI0037000C4F
MQPLEQDDPRGLGDYRLLGRLGAGGMGQVYLGRTPGGRTVAVKTVRPDLARDPEFRERFRHEVAAARRVGGEWTAPVLDADTEGVRPWVASGFVTGPSLAAAVHEHGPLPEATVRLLGVGLAEALAHVHALSLVHRDVKPSNVLLTLDGPRLIDFGIARALDAASGLTRTGHVIGSPGFMSPEQAQGQPVGAASDVFSLGAVLALAATGRQPFGEGVSAAVLLYRVLHEQPDLSAIDDPLRAVILACMAKSPEARPTPRRLRELLDPENAAAGRFGRSSWLPADLAAAVGRTAVRLLDLESESPTPAQPGTPLPTAVAPGAPLPEHAMPTVSGPPPQPPGHRLAHPVPGAGRPATQPATQPAFGPPTPAPRRGRGRRITAIVTPVLVLAALGSYGAAKLGSPGGTASPDSTSSTPTAPRADGSPVVTDGPSSDPSAGSSSEATEKTVPAAFLGTWQADHTGSDKNSRFTVRVGDAQVGDRFAAEGQAVSSTGYCDAAWTLVSITRTRLRYTSRLVGSHAMDCNTGGQRLLDLQADGTLRYSAADKNSASVVLHKAS